MEFSAETISKHLERVPTQKAASRILAAPVVTVDYELYAKYLSDTDLSEADKQLLIQTLWNIIMEFASLGFEAHPLQQIKSEIEACGQVEKKREHLSS